MKKKFSVEQIVSVLKQAEVGVPVAELIRKVGISEQTFYRWKAKYVGLEVDQVRQMKQRRDENTRLKQLVAELTLDKTMLQRLSVLSSGGKRRVMERMENDRTVFHLSHNPGCGCCLINLFLKTRATGPVPGRPGAVAPGGPWR